ncbi:hypothetical protein [Mesorhizobium opportunistum]
MQVEKIRNEISKTKDFRNRILRKGLIRSIVMIQATAAKSPG